MDFQILNRWRVYCFNKNIVILICCITAFILHNFTFLGLLYGLIIVASYFSGFYCWQFFIRDCLHQSSKLFDESDTSTSEDVKKLSESKETEILVSYPVDQALDQIFCRIIDEYISRWYSHISSDPWFQFEARSAIRRITVALCERITRVNADRFLLCKVIPICLNHVVETKSEISHLHVAVHSRRSEVYYVQNLSKCLLKYLLPSSDLNCKSYAIFLREIISKSVLLSFSDAICNPTVLNQLILRYFGNSFNSTRFEKAEIMNDDRVELLQNFVTSYKNGSPYSSLRPDVSDILKEKELLDTFMYYLRSRRMEHVLQFCLDVAAFNEKMLKPELEAEELDDLYRDAWDLFSVYFSNYSPNCINFHKDLASPLRKALSKDILKLRTTSTLFEAYEHAFSVLENFCVDFYNSGEFYRWLYGRCDGPEMGADASYALSHSVKVKESFSRKTIGEIGNKLNKFKDALKPDHVLDGRSCELKNSSSNSESHLYSTEVGIDVQLGVDYEKNMNKWKISIPSVNSRLDPITNKPYRVLVIHVIDDNDSEWIVERRPCDFHLLDSKLTEFHENLTDMRSLQIPSATIILENVKMYEDHLNTLITHPELNNSELLRSFLTASEFLEDDEEFDEEDSNFGKTFRKSVIPISRRDRGHNLDVFVKSLILSCLSTKHEWKNCEQKKPMNKKASESTSNLLYGNNFDLDANITRQVILESSKRRLFKESYNSPFSLLILIAFKIYNLRLEVIQALLIVKAAFGSLFDHFIFQATNRFLKTLWTNYNISYLINTIEWAIFDNKMKYDDEEIKRNMRKLLSGMKNDWMYPIYVSIFESLQDAKNNKQLFFNLTDAVVEELFPEIFAVSEG